MSEEIRNCTIKSTELGIEDHGIFTATLHLEGDSWGVSFGNYWLDTWDRKPGVPTTNTDGYGAIIAIMKALGVNNWESLPGKYIRAKFNGNKIVAVGHIMKDTWFSFEEYYATFTKKE